MGEYVYKYEDFDLDYIPRKGYVIIEKIMALIEDNEVIDSWEREGDSIPAPKFNIVSRHNDWGKSKKQVMVWARLKNCKESFDKLLESMEQVMKNI